MLVGSSGCMYLFTFEEEILYAWIGGLVVHRLRWAGSKIARDGEPVHNVTSLEVPYLLAS